MQVNKTSLSPTKFDKILELKIDKIEVSTSYVINNKLRADMRVLNDVLGNQQLDFINNPSGNVLCLQQHYQIENYDYGNRKFVIPDDFKIDQKYLEHIFDVIRSNWCADFAQYALSSKLMAFNELAKVVKEKTGNIVRSWEELEKTEKILELLEFEHVNSKMDIVRLLFVKLLIGDTRNRFNLFKESSLKKITNSDGFLVFTGTRPYIDQFSCIISGKDYSCTFDGTTVTMYPVVRDLMHEHEINGFKNVSKLFKSDNLTIRTSLDKLDDNKVQVVIYHNGREFERQKSTSSLVMSGITSRSFCVNFNLTIEEIKSILTKFNKTKTGLKLDLMQKLGKLTDEIIEDKKEALSKYFDSNMIVQFERQYRETKSEIVDGIDSCIVNYVLYSYIKSRIHGSALFLRNTTNELYNPENDFGKLNYIIEVKFMRLDEGIT